MIDSATGQKYTIRPTKLIVLDKVSTFCVITMFDRYGDGKSDLKVLSRKFYHTTKTIREVKAIFEVQKNKIIVFKNYKRTQSFE